MPNWKKVIVSGSDAVLSSVTATAGLTVTGSAIITGSLGIIGSFNQASSSLATGLFAHAQGFAVTASGNYSHAEGYYTTATGDYSHAEGQSTTAFGQSSHAEGSGTYTPGESSHAEGENTTATGQSSHAEGSTTVASGLYSHAEGSVTTAIGQSSHAEGESTTAIGQSSHAEGFSTVASGSYQHVQGQYNISSSAQSAFIVGNGTADGSRSNLIFASGSQVQVTGSVSATAGFTGSLLGTATTSSYVLNAVSSSFATTASFAVSASRAVSSSFATTASFAVSASRAVSSSFASTASVATILQTARTIGGVSFNGSANINLPGVNTTGNQNTSGNAATATTATTATLVTVLPSSSAATVVVAGLNKFYPLFGAVKNNGDFTSVAIYANSGSFQYIMGTNTLTVTSSYANQALSSSFATTASLTPNAIVTASVSSNTITFTKGNGTTFPITVNTSPGGSTTEIQYNNAGVFGGVPNLTWNGTTLNATGSFSGYFIPKHVSGSLSVASANYTIYNPGVYRFTATDEFMNYTIIFPDPSSMPAGQTITIINSDSYEAPYGGSYPPENSDGSSISATPGIAQTCVNIDGKWILVATAP